MGRDYIMHHGVKGQVHGHRRWQNPDGSYTDAGFIHYYGHPRIRNRKEKDSEKTIQAKDLKDLFDKLDTIANNSKYSKHRGKFGRRENLPNTIAETTPFDDYAFRMRDRLAEAKNVTEFNEVFKKFKTLAEDAVNNAPDKKKADVAGELLEWKDYALFELENAQDEYGGKKGVFSKLAMQVGENMKKSMEFRKDPENQKKYGQGIIPGLVNLYKDSKQKKAEEEARQKAYTEKRQKLRDHLDDAEDKKWRKMLSLMRDDPDIKDVYKKVLKTEWGEGLKETGKRSSDGSYYFSPYDAYASFWSYAMEDASVHDDAYYKAVYKAFDLEKNDPTIKRLREKEESLWNELEALDAQHKGGKK